MAVVLVVVVAVVVVVVVVVGDAVVTRAAHFSPSLAQPAGR